MTAQPQLPPTQRVTLTIDITDAPGNDLFAVRSLLDLVYRLQDIAITPQLIRLEIGPLPTPTSRPTG